jgi:hypothetical protein
VNGEAALLARMPSPDGSLSSLLVGEDRKPQAARLNGADDPRATLPESGVILPWNALSERKSLRLVGGQA